MGIMLNPATLRFAETGPASLKKFCHWSMVSSGVVFLLLSSQMLKFSVIASERRARGDLLILCTNL